jgi:hypothetical protein
MKKPIVRLCVEELEGRALPSVLPVHAAALLAARIRPASEQQVIFLGGNLHGSYRVSGALEQGAHYTLAGSGKLGGLGQVFANANLRSVGFVSLGTAGGTLTLHNNLGKVTLLLQGPPQPGFAALPRQFHFSVQSATGAYAGLAAEGTAMLQLRPTGPAVGRAGTGTFTLTLRPAIFPPPPTAATGIEGVALVGPISPITHPGVPNSRPLPGAIITVQSAQGGAELARVRADAQGRFVTDLPPGTYLLVPLPPTPGQTLPRGIPEKVTVPPTGFAQVVVNYDSGIV